ncbi:MAG: glucosyl-3-phosphoglycerate synthase [Victivallaceae bacterium]|nr:glucosyl-3-phosphoglycerate synthase [Victivallaceae bacterium]
MNKLQNWLNNKTFHHSEFSDIAHLVELKKQYNLTISLCFPTLNEEKTIGKSVIVMKSELMDRYPLLDEIAVIDSGSTDNTLNIAREFGAKTYTASEHLQKEGDFKGKGENLWKALHLLKGDIIVYVDADISNIHHRFVYGLVAPMLLNTEIRFVKAFYNRPFKSSAGISPSGGGRVTEILTRPLFSQFYPELTGIIQPLSGEYAGYRDILEKIPFPIGYGVETSMLIDIYERWGLDVMAQTNLDLRIHRNQHIASLGKMSFGIMQTFWSRLSQYKKIDQLVPESLILRQMRLNGTEPELLETEITERERRPMEEVKEYRKKFGKDNQ